MGRRSITASALIFFCYLFTPPPPAPLDNPNLPVNINFVSGLGDKLVQTWMPPLAWVSMVFFTLPIVVDYPTHLFLLRFAPKAVAERGWKTSAASA